MALEQQITPNNAQGQKKKKKSATYFKGQNLSPTAKSVQESQRSGVEKLKATKMGHKNECTWEGDITHMRETWCGLRLASSIHSNLCLVPCNAVIYPSLSYPLGQIILSNISDQI